METKTQKAIKLYKNGKVKDALRIFKTFRIDFTKEEKRTMEIAYEVMCGRSVFYNSLGIDTDKVIDCAKTTIEQKYLS